MQERVCQEGLAPRYVLIETSQPPLFRLLGVLLRMNEWLVYACKRGQNRV
jgi:hypothetical protein